MTVSDLQEAYHRLRDQLLQGDLNEEDFRAAVEQLKFRDELGNQWKIGWYTGKWYRNDQGQWIQDTPVEGIKPGNRPDSAQASRAKNDGRRRFALAPCLVITLVGLLLAASALLIFGWNFDWWQRSPEDVAVATSTTPTGEATAQPTATARPAAATSLPTASPAPSDTPSPTATQKPTTTPKTQSATPATTPTQSSASTLTPSPTRTPSRVPTSASVRPTATPSLSGRIYFPVYDPNPDRRTYDIHVVDLASGDREIMLGQASQPALSPSGTRLAYRSWDIHSRGIRVRELADENTWEWIGFHEAEHPSWSPDNLSLAFSSQQEIDRNWRLYRTRGLDIERVEREGGDIYGRVPAWSMDGRLVYWECPLGGCGLYATHPDGTGSTRLTTGEHDTAPAVSPDGREIAFMSSKDGDWEIYVVGAYPTGPELEEPRQLTTNGSSDGLPAWSPNGKWIAFASNRGGTWAIWAMRADGSGKRKLFELGGPLMGEVANVPPTEQHGWTWEAIAWGE